MPLVFSALLDPLPQQVDLLGSEVFIGFRRWHQFVFVSAGDAINQFTVLEIAGDNGLGAGF